MGRRRLFLHLGTHKTGTTALQVFLGTHAASLRDGGVLYPATGWRDGHPAHHNIAWELVGDRRFAPAFGTLATLRAEMARHAGDVILSSEDFIGATRNPAGFAAFLEVLRSDGFDVTLLLFLRNQADYAASLYLTLIQLEYGRDFRLYLDALCTTGELRYRDWCFPFCYDRLVGTLLALPAALAVRSYDTARRGDLLGGFLAACGIDRATFAGAPLPRANLRSPLWEGMKTFHRTRFGDGNLDALFAAAERVLPRAQTYHAPERARLAACFSEANERVSAHWDIALDPLYPADVPEARPLTSMSDLFSTEFHALLAAAGNLGERGPGPLKEELRRQRDSYERTLSWRVTAPLRALHARFHTRSRRRTSI